MYVCVFIRGLGLSCIVGLPRASRIEIWLSPRFSLTLNNTQMSSPIHIGSIIRDELRRQGKTNNWFAIAINYKTSLELTMGEGVKPGVTYYVRGVAKVGEVYSYGEVLSITMQPSKE